MKSSARCLHRTKESIFSDFPTNVNQEWSVNSCRRSHFILSNIKSQSSYLSYEERFFCGQPSIETIYFMKEPELKIDRWRECEFKPTLNEYCMHTRLYCPRNRFSISNSVQIKKKNTEFKFLYAIIPLPYNIILMIATFIFSTVFINEAIPKSCKQKIL